METKNLSADYGSIKANQVVNLSSNEQNSQETKTAKNAGKDGVSVSKTSETELKPEELGRIAEDFNQKMKSIGNNSIRFQLDGKTKQVIIQVVDEKSHEIVKEIPSEDVRALREHIDSIKGILLDKMI